MRVPGRLDHVTITQAALAGGFPPVTTTIAILRGVPSRAGEGGYLGAGRSAAGIDDAAGSDDLPGDVAGQASENSA